MRTEGRPPHWAIDLIEKACADWNVDPPAEFSWRRSGPKIGWRATYRRDGAERPVVSRTRSLLERLPEVIPGTIERVTFAGPNHGSSGRCYGTWRIVVTAGTDRVDQRFVMAHELAHHIGHSLGLSKGHDKPFYDILARLLRRYPNRTGTIRYAISRDGRPLAAACRRTK